jgi:major membrane immunogen (membrane-anchored lipoprotein)
MKIADKIFKSVGYVIILGGLALLIFYAVYPSELYGDADYNYVSETEKSEYVTETTNQTSQQNTENAVIENQKEETSTLEGHWKVTYNSQDLKGAMVYSIKKEGKKFIAYTYEMQDENGYGQKTPAEKALTIKSFNGKRANGTYKLEYEGKTYDVPCKIKLIDTNTFQLSYDYYGYGDTETWKRVL